MFGRAGRWLLLVGLFARLAAYASGPGSGCRQVMLAGEASRGQAFAAPLGEGLKIYLQPIASGWIVRVVPAGAFAIDPDYAEVATPPYHSVTPLSLSTDFSFRAQDAAGWNPRRFRFASSLGAYRKLVALYRQLPPDGSRANPELQQAVVEEISAAASGQLEILDVALVPGSANQGRAAAAVSSRFSATAHTMVAAPGFEGSPLGVLLRIRFRLVIDLPLSFRPAATLQPAGACTLIF